MTKQPMQKIATIRVAADRAATHITAEMPRAAKVLDIQLWSDPDSLFLHWHFYVLVCTNTAPNDTIKRQYRVVAADRDLIDVDEAVKYVTTVFDDTHQPFLPHLRRTLHLFELNPLEVSEKPDVTPRKEKEPTAVSRAS